MKPKKQKQPKARVGRLTAKQEAFAIAYAATGIGATAYREAYDVGSMKPGSIYREASLLLDHPHVSQRIKDLQGKAMARAEISAGRVLREYGKIAFHDIRNAFDAEGNLKPIHEMDDATAAAVAGLEFEDMFAGTGNARIKVGRLAKIKLSDKKAALDSLAKHLGMGAAQPSILPNGIETGQITFEEFIQIHRKGVVSE